ncbi:hypothetical protein AAL_07058 [Moelleriella libera RCEF 2490]|uniref:Uncharacterized protein n=1 Tax=Moelleriella libera RCEF 2490 TaxID=1081109 RepID=A0A167Y3Y1_9HYPO|nr:hypothetical protein AAL_07058 [Moelleriella libera RCEF 2490]
MHQPAITTSPDGESLLQNVISFLALHLKSGLNWADSRILKALDSKSLLQNVIDFLALYLKSGLNWAGSRILWILKALNGTRLLQNVIDFLAVYLKNGLYWAGSRILWILKALNGTRLLQNVIDFLAVCLKNGLYWAGSWILWILKALFRAARISDLLQFVSQIIWQVFTWYAIVFVLFHIIPIVRYVRTLVADATDRCLQIYDEQQRKRLEAEAIQRYEFHERQRAAEAAAEAAAERERRRLQARAEEAAREERERYETQRRRENTDRYLRWEEECNRVLLDKPSMTRFPFPPLPPCLTPGPGCSASPQAPAPPCQHNVRQFLEWSGKFSIGLVKQQRNNWHEDRFGTCRKDLMPKFKELATSLFVALTPLYEGLSSEEAGSSQAQ